jgi:hypothetical protein
VAIDTRSTVISVTGEVVFGNGDSAKFSIDANGTEVQGRALGAAESMRVALMTNGILGDRVNAGDPRTYVISVYDEDGGYPEDVTLHAVLAEGIDGGGELVPIVRYPEASVFLEKWGGKGPKSRNYHSDDRDDADIVLAWVHNDRLVFDVWPFHESNVGPSGYSLDVLLDGTLFTNTHYMIREASA